MTTSHRIAFCCYLVPALLLLGFGIRYLTASEFMSYHEAAIGRPWGQLEPHLQGTMLAALRGGGAGFLITAVCLLILLLIPFRRGEPWARWAVPAVAMLYALLGLNTALTLTLLTPATAPWHAALAMVAFIVVGAFFSFRSPRA